MLWWTWFVFLSVTVSANDDSEWNEVRIAQGTVRGHKDGTGEIWTFLNIPYARAPTGKKKFKAPLPPPVWTEPYDAIDKGIICPQFDFKPIMPEYLVMQEDCLVANVYVPDTVQKDLSVLVFIHGGGFQIGYGDWLKSKNFMKYKDFIVVTFNYRLGIHGFLCLGTEDAPGNAGMKDQLALLHWVQKNIAAFGGNPKDVTLSGYSAGSASVDLLMISKSSDGLFHKGIPESGSNLGPFAIQIDPLENAKNRAKQLNFTDVNDVDALEMFYQNLSYETLVGDGFMDTNDASLLFGPCIENGMTEEAFLTESPLTILKRGDYKKLPLLYGFSNMEGLLRINFFDTVYKDKMNEKFSEFVPGNLKFRTQDEKEEVAKHIKEFYFGDEPLSEENILSYVEYFSDVFFVYPGLWAVKLYAESGHDQVYFYEYSFFDEDTPVVLHTNVRGANHCDQTYALHDGRNLTHFHEDDLSVEFKKMKKIIREMWHNFIKTGKPVPEGSSLPPWPSVNANRSPYMSLGQKVELRGVLAEERGRLWDGIYEKYYREPIPPPRPSSKLRTEL